jgi:protein mago nashi
MIGPIQPIKIMEEFYLRYRVGHVGKFGHEYLEFEFHQNGKFVYCNSSEYKRGHGNDDSILKSVFVTDIVLDQLKEMILESRILQCDDKDWPLPDRNGEQELEIVYMNHHISFHTTKIGTLSDTFKTQDPKGLYKFYFLIQDLKSISFSILHLFKTVPI